MNRKQLRSIGADSIPRVTVILRNLAPALGLTRPVNSSNTYIGRDDNNLLAEAIRGALEQMGVDRYDLAAAMLFHAINSMFPMEQGMDFRRLVAWGITVGADYTIEQESVVLPASPAEGDPATTELVLTVRPFPAFPPVVSKVEAKRSKLWAPGDPV